MRFRKDTGYVYIQIDSYRTARQDFTFLNNNSYREFFKLFFVRVFVFSSFGVKATFLKKIPLSGKILYDNR